MKKWIVSLVLILAVQIGYKIAPVLAQGDTDALEVKKVVEAFLEDLVSDDMDSAIQWVSVNYSDIRGDNVIDYVKFKSELENRINNFFKNHIDHSTSDLKLDNLDIQDNKATLKVKYNWKAFNLDILKEDSGKIERQVSLTKENGIWKITQWTQWRKIQQPQ